MLIDMGVKKITGSSLSSHDGVTRARLISSLLRTRKLAQLARLSG